MFEEEEDIFEPEEEKLPQPRKMFENKTMNILLGITGFIIVAVIVGITIWTKM